MLAYSGNPSQFFLLSIRQFLLFILKINQSKENPNSYQKFSKNNLVPIHIQLPGKK